MTKFYFILFIAIATVSAQATGDITALEKKIKLLETKISSIQATGERKMETLERRLEDHETRRNTKMETFNTRLE